MQHLWTAKASDSLSLYPAALATSPELSVHPLLERAGSDRLRGPSDQQSRQSGLPCHRGTEKWMSRALQQPSGTGEIGVEAAQ